jgi:hypothetical protein
MADFSPLPPLQGTLEGLLRYELPSKRDGNGLNLTIDFPLVGLHITEQLFQ